MFSDAHRERAALKGIDLDDSYRCLLLEIRVGGPVYMALLKSIAGRREEITRPVTRSQLLLLERLANGRSVPKAADDLHINVETARAQLRVVFKRLGARNMTHAVAIAIRRGLIKPPSAVLPAVAASA